MQHSRYFRALQPAGDGGLSLVLELVDWIGSYVALVVPGHGIRGWQVGSLPYASVYAIGSCIPVVGPTTGRPDGPACTVRRSVRAGRVIEVGLREPGSIVRLFCWAESEATDDKCWEVARACSDALETILLDGRVPEIVRLAELLASRTQPADGSAPLRGAVRVQHDPTTLEVAALGDDVIDFRRWPDGGEPTHEVQALVHDWCAVLRAMKVEFFVDGPDIPGLNVACLKHPAPFPQPRERAVLPPDALSRRRLPAHVRCLARCRRKPSPTCPLQWSRAACACAIHGRARQGVETNSAGSIK